MILLDKTAKTPERQQWTVPCPIGLALEYYTIRVFQEWIQYILTLYGTIRGFLFYWPPFVVLLKHSRGTGLSSRHGVQASMSYLFLMQSQYQTSPRIFHLLSHQVTMLLYL